MNKRKAKKKYKQIYEQKLASQPICINFDDPFFKKRVKRVIVREKGRTAEFFVSFTNIEIEPTGTDLYPNVHLNGYLKLALDDLLFENEQTNEKLPFVEVK